MMTHEESLAWAKEHGKEFVKTYIERFRVTQDFGDHSCIFMGGLPGAGKTELSKRLLEQIRNNSVRIDMDEIASMIPEYTAKEADKYRAAASRLQTAIFSKITRERLNFLMDGTFGGPHVLQNIAISKRRGYRIRAVFVYQDPKIAWNFTKIREKIEHRAIEMDGFIDTYFKIRDNLNKLRELSYVQIDLVVKNEINKILSISENVDYSKIDNLFKNNYNKDELRNLLS